MIELLSQLDRHIGLVTLLAGIITAFATFCAVFLTSWQDRNARKYEYKYKYYHDKLHEFAKSLSIIIKRTEGLLSSEPSENINNDIYSLIPLSIFEISGAKNNYITLTKINKRWKVDSKVLKYFDDLIQIQLVKQELFQKRQEWFDIQLKNKNVREAANNFEKGFEFMEEYNERNFILESAIDKKDILKRLNNLQEFIDKEFEIG